MIISIDATGLGAARTGTAIYLLEILRVWNANDHIPHRFVIFASPKSHRYFVELALDGRFTIKAAPDNRALRIAWQQLVLPFLIRRNRCGVHWGTGFVLPLLSTCPSVVVVYDITFRLFPAVHEPIKRWYFPWMIGQAVKKARVVITISETTRRDLVTHYPSAEGKTEVTLLAARHISTKTPSTGGNGSDHYILAIGTLEPRKNLVRLIHAWLGLESNVRRGMRLLIAGAQGWMIRDLVAEAIQAHEAGIELLGFVDDNKLAQLLSNATALAYPSLYEGFGLPVLEAMANGIPVLTSATGATLEVAGDAALLVDPYDELSIRHGLEQLLVDTNLREQLRKKGLVRSRNYSWEQTASQTLQILERVANARKFQE